jgi:hypothetical protein
MQIFELPCLVPQIRKPIIPDGYREMSINGCNYLVHESEIPPHMSGPVAIEEVFDSIWGCDAISFDGSDFGI